MAQDCVFCKIIRKEIPAKIAFEDDQVLAFHDINPAAPVHILLIPKRHVEKVGAVPSGDNLVSVITDRAVKLAEEIGIAKDGFRLVFNNGDNGGQTVYHLHLHLLGGRFMNWPPG
jgi:histidine triad (HIT) family protein